MNTQMKQAILLAYRRGKPAITIAESFGFTLTQINKIVLPRREVYRPLIKKRIISRIMIKPKASFSEWEEVETNLKLKRKK